MRNSKLKCGAVADYRLSSQAKADLREIYRYGVATFGERQADAYLLAFYDRFAQIAKMPDSFPSAFDVDEGLRRSVCGQDTIYYAERDGTVVIEFINGRQDVRQRRGTET